MIDKIERAIVAGENQNSKLNGITNPISGLTSWKIRNFLNCICEGDDVVYFEVGCLYGSTLQSASYRNNGLFIGVDNFSEFEGSENALLKNFMNQDDCKINFVNYDCFDPMFLGKLSDFLKGKNINIYFYDGNHKMESQMKALTNFYGFLADEFIYIVDDWNWEEVREGTNRSITGLEMSIIYKKEFYTAGNSVNDWWNGFAIFLLKKEK